MDVSFFLIIAYLFFFILSTVYLISSIIVLSNKFASFLGIACILIDLVVFYGLLTGAF